MNKNFNSVYEEQSFPSEWVMKGVILNDKERVFT